MRSLPERFKISESVKKHHESKRGGPNQSVNARFDLTHRLWKDAVMQRDNFTCQICQKPAQVAHHVESYHDNPALRHVVQNGQALCRACHARLHWDHEKMAESREKAKKAKELKSKLEDAKRHLEILMQNPRFSHPNHDLPS